MFSLAVLRLILVNGIEHYLHAVFVVETHLIIVSTSVVFRNIATQFMNLLC